MSTARNILSILGITLAGLGLVALSTLLVLLRGVAIALPFVLIIAFIYWLA